MLLYGHIPLQYQVLHFECIQTIYDNNPTNSCDITNATMPLSEQLHGRFFDNKCQCPVLKQVASLLESHTSLVKYKAQQGIDKTAVMDRCHISLSGIGVVISVS